jgi:hypothetical protein
MFLSTPTFHENSMYKTYYFGTNVWLLHPDAPPSHPVLGG